MRATWTRFVRASAVRKPASTSSSREVTHSGAVNPRTGHEDVLPKQSAPAVTAKKIGVVGGGPAGMNFAIYAAQRGHTVEILEKTSELGGIGERRCRSQK